MRFLKFVLASSLQSWGGDAPWDYRKTELFPTKSAIVGLLSACFGYKRGDQRIAELGQKICVAIRADKPGILLDDFQVVNSNRNYLIAAHGKARVSSTNKIVLHKYYLQDARFTVFIHAEEHVLSEINRAMRSPEYLTFLGRKCCVPSYPLIPVYVEATDLESAVSSFTGDEIERIKARSVQVEIESDKAPLSLSRVQSLMRHDELLNSEEREISHRKVYRYSIIV